MKKILIAGATSAIARGFARAAAERGDALFLVGRSEPRLNETAADLRIRGASFVGTFVMDLRDMGRQEEMVTAADKAMGGLDSLLVAHGTLTDQPQAQQDIAYLQQEIATNFTSAATLLTMVAARFEKQKSGALGVITSVAGDRGRQKHYTYGACKAALTAFLSGMRGRLLPAGVTVTEVRPGFVDTPMTASTPKNALFAQPEPVGRAIYRAMDRGQDVVYLPMYWRLIMLIIKSIPETVFKRLNI